MFKSLELFRMAQGLAQHAAARQSAVARNLANVDTPGYRQRDIPDFAEAWRAAGREGLGGSGPFSPLREQAVRGARPDPNGNTVSLEGEMLKSAQIRQQHEMAMAVYKSALSQLRSTLGRR